MRIQLYLALIGAVLVTLWTGKRPNKRQMEALQFYFRKRNAPAQPSSATGQLK